MNIQVPDIEEDDSGAASRRLIGVRLQKLRERAGLSLREAASRASLSHSFVAMVERGQSEIGVSRLIRLADVYGAGISELLDIKPSIEGEFVDSSATYGFPTGMDDVTIHYLSSPSWGLQPFLVDLNPRARLEDLRHPGDEFLHCLSGSPVIVVNGVSWHLNAGDTIIIPDEAVHSYVNVAPDRATLIGAVARPSGRPQGGSVV